MFTRVPYVQLIIMLCFYKVCILRLVTKNYNFILVTRNSFREDFFRIHHVVMLMKNSKWIHLEQFQISSKVEGGWVSFFEIYIKNKPLSTLHMLSLLLSLFAFFFVCESLFRTRTLVSKGQNSFGIQRTKCGVQYLKQGIMQKIWKTNGIEIEVTDMRFCFVLRIMFWSTMSSIFELANQWWCAFYVCSFLNLNFLCERNLHKGLNLYFLPILSYHSTTYTVQISKRVNIFLYMDNLVLGTKRSSVPNNLWTHIGLELKPNELVCKGFTVSQLQLIKWLFMS
jgi:hypothetical protein